MVFALVSAPVARAESCPAPKTCSDYALFDHRWPVTAGKPLVIDYWINPAGQAFVSGAELEGAVAAAARAWQRANPRVVFRYQGLTQALPGIEDGINVIGFAPSRLPTALASAQISHVEGRIREADMALSPTTPWSWVPCQQRDGSCDRAPGEPVDVLGVRSATPAVDLQGIVLHELGHWLSLDHVDEESHSQTMATVAPTDLSLQTLALGDVLGVRAAYPCGTCGGKPVVFAP